VRNSTRASRVSATRTLVTVIAALLALGAAAAAPAAQRAIQVGYTGPSFAGLGAEVSGGAVTGQKPESKLWYHDGSWWAPLITPSGAHTIHRLVGTTWQNTGVLVDARVTSREDALSLGSTLYVLVRAESGAKLTRFSYAAGAYTLDSGFPVSVPGAGAETLTLARDSTGTLWLTYEQGSQIFVAHTLGSDATWGAAFVVPGGTGLDADDISAVISFTDSAGPAIGVMWSNQNDDAQHFAVHRDGSGDSAWTHETALSGTNEADDHINLKTYAGYVFAVVKTSLDSAGSAAPLIKLLVRTPSGSWNAHRVATVGEGNTRPITLLQIDPAVRTAYVFMTIGEGPSSRGIAYKQTSIDSINFPANRTVFIQGANSEVINDATSTKQNLNGASGVVVAASDGSKYWWNRIDPSGPPPNTEPTASPSEASTTKDAPVPVVLQGGDAETCELAFSIAAPPAHGTLGALAAQSCTSGSPNTDAATVTYTPVAGYTGSDSFSFQVSDGSLTSAPATVSVTVNDTPPPPTSVGVVFRSASGDGNATATSLVLSAPAGIAVGDLLLASIDVRGSPGITAPAGWTLVRSDQSGYTIKQAIYYKVATVSEPASYTWSWGGAQGASGGISAYSGVDSSAPIAASAGQVNASSTSITAPSVTTTGPNQLVVGVFGTAAATAIAPPSGYSERFDAFATAGTYRTTSELSDRPQVSPGSSGILTATAGATAVNIGQTVALKPA
jgi:Big-like domain-containing protein